MVLFLPSPDIVRVVATVIEHSLAARVIIFKKKRRNNYKRKRGKFNKSEKLFIKNRLLQFNCVASNVPDCHVNVLSIVYQQAIIQIYQTAMLMFYHCRSSSRNHYFKDQQHRTQTELEVA